MRFLAAQKLRVPSVEALLGLSEVTDQYMRQHIDANTCKEGRQQVERRGQFRRKNGIVKHGWLCFAISPTR